MSSALILLTEQARTLSNMMKATSFATSRGVTAYVSNHGENTGDWTPTELTSSRSRVFSSKRGETFLSIRTPTTWLARVYKLQLQTVCGRWKVELSIPSIVPSNSPALNLARKGDLMGLQQLLAIGKASPSDCNTDGDTVLHV